MSKIAVAISGGKDSTATLLLAIEEYSNKNVLGIFLDTGFESSLTYQYIDYLQEILNIQIIKLKSKKWKDLPTLIRLKKRFPSIKYRFCTTKLKQIPAAEFLSTQKEIKELWFGLRCEESKKRKERYKNISADYKWNYTEWLKISCGDLKKDIRNKVSHIYCRFPIIHWTKEQVFNYIKQKKIEINPLYKKGFSRVGCYPCILARKYEYELCWADPEGKKNILLLAKIEKELNEKGFHTKLKPHLSAQELIKYLKKREIEKSLF